jgi:uncharacterized protein YjbI with pentapeptide repeats
VAFALTLTDRRDMAVKDTAMANPEHLALLDSGRIDQARTAGQAIDFRDANLSGRRLHNADLSIALLERANLSGTDLSAARLDSASLQNANLSGANLKAARLDSANLQSADLSGAVLSAARLRGARLDETNLQNADLSDADCTGAIFQGADLPGAKVSSGTILVSTNLGGAKLDREILRIATISKASLTGQDLSHFDLSRLNLNGVNFASVTLCKTNFSAAELIEARFDQANAEGAIFNAANLTQAFFDYANLMFSAIVEANLTRARFLSARLRGANISKANFYEATLSNASMDLVVGARLAKNLLTTKNGQQPVNYFDTAVRSWPERWLDWERLRIFGRLPLFGASYTGLIIIPVYVYVLGIYNDKVEATRIWLAHSFETGGGISATAAEAILNRLCLEAPWFYRQYRYRRGFRHVPAVTAGVRPSCAEGGHGSLLLCRPWRRDQWRQLVASDRRRVEARD